MATTTQTSGGNDTSALWNHVVDLHRKHSELQMQLHDKQGGEQGGMEEMHAAVTELTATIKELIAVMKDDVKSDKAVANGKRAGKREQSGAGGRTEPPENEA